MEPDPPTKGGSQGPNDVFIPAARRLRGLRRDNEKAPGAWWRDQRNPGPATSSPVAADRRKERQLRERRPAAPTLSREVQWVKSMKLLLPKPRGSRAACLVSRCLYLISHSGASWPHRPERRHCSHGLRWNGTEPCLGRYRREMPGAARPSPPVLPHQPSARSRRLRQSLRGASSWVSPSCCQRANPSRIGCPQTGPRWRCAAGVEATAARPRR
jgi:hypothetical protein